MKPLKPVFIRPSPEWEPLVSNSSMATRNTKPFVKEVPNLDTQFKQEVYNTSVRDRKFSEEKTTNEELFTDIILQLNAARGAARHFESEGNKLRSVVDRISENYGKLFIDYIDLRDKYDRLEIEKSKRWTFFKKIISKS